MPHHYVDDSELFRQIAEGNEQAFEAVFRRYLPRLKSFVIGIVKVEAITDEILQEFFLKMWLRKEDLVHVQNPLSWCYKIASNLALDQLRRQVTEYKAIRASIEADSSNADDLFEHLSAKQLQEIIYEAVESLPEQRRKIYRLAKESGWSHKKVAEYLGISVQTVKNQVVNAVKAIQQHILQSSGIFIPFFLLIFEINFPTA